MKKDTICLRGGYVPGNGEPTALPIYQSTTYKYETTEEVAKLFDLTSNGFFYSRLANPTVDAVEKKLAELEGGVGAMCTSSGQAANFLSIFNIAKAGDHIITSSSIYGGTYNLFNVTMRKMGIDFTFVDNNITDEELDKLFRPNTKAVFGETLTNPTIEVFDIERFANVAHKHNVPLIVDNTFATPVLCTPISFGADIVTHSTTKYLDGHAVQVGGVIIDSGKFDWACGNFPEFTEPDDSYHGVVYTKDFGNMAYIVKARVQLMRDFGCNQTANGAFLLNLGIETLDVRMKKHCENAQKVAEFLYNNDKVEFVNYPTVPGYRDKALSDKYLPNGASGVIAFSLKAGREAGAKFIDSLKMITLAVHVADAKSCILHPASATHRQLSDKQLEEAGVLPGLVRLSVGIENVEDIIEDIKQALEQI